MNLAFADHEIISDYATAAYMWFESGCAAQWEERMEAQRPSSCGCGCAGGTGLCAAAPAHPAASASLLSHRLLRRGKADFQELLEGWTYGWPPTTPFSYGVGGIEDATSAAQKPPNPLVTRPGTLPGCALEHLVQDGDYCFQARRSAAVCWPGSCVDRGDGRALSAAG